MRVALLLLVAAAPSANFTSELWTGIQPVFEKTLQHPFLTGLVDGTLPPSRFQFYLTQDALYLRAFGQVLSVLASKAPREDWAITLNQHAVETLQVERRLHESILGSYGVRPEASRAADMAPANRAYTNHLLATVHRGSFAEGLAAVLPCYWIYWEVGKDLRTKGSKRAEYQRWIDQYSGAEYARTVNQVLTMMNAEAARADAPSRARLKELFTRSARYEYLFWDMAWREERWLP